MFLKCILYTIITLFARQTECFSEEITMDQCPYLYALYNGDPQTSDTPYILTADKEYYMPNETISIKLKAIDNNITFKGFMITVRRVTGDTESLIGSFTRYPKWVHSYSWYPEDYIGENCITNSNAELRTELNVEWRAPTISVGDIIIRAVVIQNHDVFWTTQNLVIVKSQYPCEEEEFTNVVTRAYRTIDTKECGQSKGCYVYPKKCSGINCYFIISWKYDESTEEVEIEMSGETEGYLSVSFGDSKRMPGSKGFHCSVQYDIMKIESMHVPDYTVEKDRITGVRDLNLGRDGDTIYCKITTHVASYIGYGELEGITWNLKDPHYIQFARGALFKDSDGEPDVHADLPIVSFQSTSVTNYILMSGTGVTLELNVHVNFHLFARMGLAGIAILVARHFQFALKNRYFGTSVWLGIHISFNILTLALMVIGIAILAVYRDGWTTTASVHGILGLIVTFLMALLIVSGFVRPKRSSSYYDSFLYGHRILGYVTFFLAAYVCIRGFQCTLLEPHFGRRGTFIVIIWLLFHVIFDLLFEINTYRKNVKAENDELTGLTFGSVKKSVGKEYVLLSLYLTGNLFFSVVGFYYVSIG